MFRPGVLAGAIINAAMGVLYVWGLFLLPLETSLNVSRSSLSLAPAVALVSFTIGMMMHSWLLQRCPLPVYILIAFALCGGGHALFWVGGSLVALITGYGVLFGSGAGLGYGLSLALASRVPAAARSWTIGLVMAAFAFSGTVLSIVFAGPIARSDPASSFGVAALCFAATGIVVSLMLRNETFGSDRPSKPVLRWRDALQPQFLRLAFTFFVLCYAGLMVMSHATGMLASQGASSRFVAAGPAVFTAAYILGCLGGGKAVETCSRRLALVCANGIMAAGLVILLTSHGWAALWGIAAIGAVFGSTASLMPVLIADIFGLDRVGAVYGRLMVCYGSAGLLAPWLSGLAFEYFHGYSAPLILALCLLAFAAALDLVS